jgi:D-hydroxyproline dehydrogenase subunit beta
MPAQRTRPTVDVVVIGGGIVGVSAAAHLAERGRRVVLVEKTAIAAGASGRNSGVVQHPFDSVLVELYVETLALYRDLDGLDIAPEPAGLLSVTHDVDGARRLAVGLAAMYPHLEPAFLEPSEVRRLEPSVADGVAACRLSIGYPVGPAAATHAYLRLAEHRGVETRIGDARIWRDDERVLGVAMGDGERLAASDVVVAAGPWTPGIVDPSGAWQPIVCRWGVVVPVTLPDPPRHVLEEAEISIEPDSGEDDAAAHAFSLVTAVGSSSLGSTFLVDEPDPSALVSSIVRRGASFVPAIADAPRDQPRLCARPLSLDGRPLIGRVPGTDALWVAAGHGPWGISTGPASGRLIADLVAGVVSPTPTALDAARFEVPRI